MGTVQKKDEERIKKEIEDFVNKVKPSKDDLNSSEKEIITNLLLNTSDLKESYKKLKDIFNGEKNITIANLVLVFSPAEAEKLKEILSKFSYDFSWKSIDSNSDLVKTWKSDYKENKNNIKDFVTWANTKGITLVNIRESGILKSPDLGENVVIANIRPITTQNTNTLSSTTSSFTEEKQKESNTPQEKSQKIKFTSSLIIDGIDFNKKDNEIPKIEKLLEGQEVVYNANLEKKIDKDPYKGKTRAEALLAEINNKIGKENENYKYAEGYPKFLKKGDAGYETGKTNYAVKLEIKKSSKK